MKKVLGMTTAAIFGLGVFTATADAATVVNTDVLNIRQAPNTNSHILGKVKNGQTLQVKNDANNWLEIEYNGKKAYVSKPYTKDDGVYYVTADVLNVRDGAGTNHNVIGKLKDGQRVQVVGDGGNGWAVIAFKGGSAYVSKEFLGAQTEHTQTTQTIHTQTTHTQTAKPQVKSAQEIQVVATSYTPYEEDGYNGMTATGINLRKNPNMKLIAVDPKVIPLGSKVWVEGYGEAIAGDTGGAIKGNRIDVLKPTQNEALQWGRKTVTVRVLD
ncbi:3D domain-containing protein [Ectobacillus panaciterrae]|uniref:3D domain-containing protein n=1 Tax=Ectobacillus panaciterrae TaxID=363872 RepID=UPI0003FA6BA4|nr:3D domain-containing protein [Ectobacillus panaciterrae]